MRSDYIQTNDGEWNRWSRMEPLITPSGTYTVKITLLGGCILDPLVLQAAEHLSGFILREHSYLSKLIYEYIQWAAHSWGHDVVFDEEPFEGEPIPTDVTPQTVLAAIGGGTARVDLLYADQPLKLSILCDLPFEHGLTFAIEGSVVTEINGHQFSLDSEGRLVWD
jgi:hypothetical protein